jgi:hypothetical protein
MMKEPVKAERLDTVLPDLINIPLDALKSLGDSALARSIKLYRQRLKETGVPLSSFNARI